MAIFGTIHAGRPAIAPDVDLSAIRNHLARFGHYHGRPERGDLNEARAFFQRVRARQAGGPVAQAAAPVAPVHKREPDPRSPLWTDAQAAHKTGLQLHVIRTAFADGQLKGAYHAASGELVFWRVDVEFWARYKRNIQFSR